MAVRCSAQIHDVGAEFREYCKKINVTQVTSSPEYAQSYGLDERHIQTVKNVLLKMFLDGKSL